MDSAISDMRGLMPRMNYAAAQDINGLVCGVDPLRPYVTFHAPLEENFSDTKLAVVTVGGNIALSTVQYPYLSKSAAFDGVGDYLEAPYHAGLDLGAGDFCAEAWVYVNAYRAAAACLMGTYTFGGVDGASGNNAGWHFGLGSSGALQAGWGNNGSYNSLGVGSTAVGLGGWRHVALTRSGSTVRLFNHGVIDSTVTDGSNLTFSYKTKFYVGSYRRGDGASLGSDISFSGYMKDIRITKGAARYTAAFTPAKVQFAR